ncbi:MAG: glycosyltransferase [Bacilli bacterium]|nr:glycosyltransferase [Bacilli bacterium]
MGKTKKSKLLTVIVPVYNVEKYLDTCIKSIINQTYSNLEIILVDDGSKDDSGRICDKYAEKDKRIKVIHKENEGLSEARNLGIKLSKGDYITFVDSDDYIDERMYEILIHDLEYYDVDIATCDYLRVEDYSKKAEISNEVNIYGKKEALCKLLKNEEYKDYAWNKVYKKKLFKDIWYPKGRVQEDVAVTYKLIINGNNVSYNKSKLYFYLKREGSIIDNWNIKNEVDLYISAFERYKYIRKNYGDFLENNRYFLIVTCDLFDKCYLCLSDDVVKETKKIVKYISKKNDIKKLFPFIKKMQIAILIFNSNLYRIFMFFYRKLKKYFRN